MNMHTTSWPQLQKLTLAMCELSLYLVCACSLCAGVMSSYSSMRSFHSGTAGVGAAVRSRLSPWRLRLVLCSSCCNVGRRAQSPGVREPHSIAAVAT